MRGKPLVFAVSGIKNSGKTTLITKLVEEFVGRGCRVAVIKHDGHDFDADVEGTDSYRHKQAGAYGTAVFSGNKFMLVKEQKNTETEEMISAFPEADFIILEGMKASEYPKIEIIRSTVSEEPVCRADTVFAYATDIDAEREWKKNVPVCFALDDISELADYIQEVFE